MSSGLKARLEQVRARVADAAKRSGRAPEDVRLIAVSKRQPDALLHEAYEAGQRDFGENYMQELQRKRALLPDARWHMIGHLQRNKAKLIDGVSLLHTLDSTKLGGALSKHSEAPVQVLIEVNIAQEESKAGVLPDALDDFVRSLLKTEACAKLSLRGLMCIPRAGEGRRFFAQLRSLRDRLEKEHGLSLPELSMGMSGDFEDAIEEGATLVRVGTAIFGARQA